MKYNEVLSIWTLHKNVMQRKIFMSCTTIISTHFPTLCMLTRWPLGDVAVITFTLSVVFLARFFIASCIGICYLTTSSVAGGASFVGMMDFPFFVFFPFSVHVQFMERFYVCVYIKLISLHKFVYTKLFIVTRQERIAKSRTFTIDFFPSTLWYCIA